MTNKGTVAAVAAIICATATMPGIAHAEATQGFEGRGYIGLSAGRTDTSDLPSAWDDQDKGIQVQVGFAFDNGLDISLMYADFGDFTAHACAAGSCADARLGADTKGVALSYRFDAGSGLKIMPKLGYHFWELDLTGSLVSLSGSTLIIAPFAGEDDGSDLFYGLGISYSATDSVDIYAGYDLYKVDDDDLRYLHLGARYHF